MTTPYSSPIVPVHPTSTPPHDPLCLADALEPAHGACPHCGARLRLHPSADSGPHPCPRCHNTVRWLSAERARRWWRGALVTHVLVMAAQLTLFHFWIWSLAKIYAHLQVALPPNVLICAVQVLLIGYQLHRLRVHHRCLEPLQRSGGFLSLDWQVPRVSQEGKARRLLSSDTARARLTTGDGILTREASATRYVLTGEPCPSCKHLINIDIPLSNKPHGVRCPCCGAGLLLLTGRAELTRALLRPGLRFWSSGALVAPSLMVGLTLMLHATLEPSLFKTVLVACLAVLSTLFTVGIAHDLRHVLRGYARGGDMLLRCNDASFGALPGSVTAAPHAVTALAPWRTMGSCPHCGQTLQTRVSLRWAMQGFECPHCEGSVRLYTRRAHLKDIGFYMGGHLFGMSFQCLFMLFHVNLLGHIWHHGKAILHMPLIALIVMLLIGITAQTLLLLKQYRFFARTWGLETLIAAKPKLADSSPNYQSLMNPEQVRAVEQSALAYEAQGAVSLSEPESQRGELSAAHTTDGALSLPEEEDETRRPTTHALLAALDREPSSFAPRQNHF